MLHCLQPDCSTPRIISLPLRGDARENGQKGEGRGAKRRLNLRGYVSDERTRQNRRKEKRWKLEIEIKFILRLNIQEESKWRN